MEQQLANGKAAANPGSGASTYITFNSLLHNCRQQFIVSSEAVLKAQLAEFRDHRIVVSKRGTDGSELLQVNLKVDTMEELLATWS